MKLIKTVRAVPVPVQETTHIIELTDNEVRNLYALIGTTTSQDMIEANLEQDEENRFTTDVSYRLYVAFEGLIL
jgi:hypothetical protein